MTLFNSRSSILPRFMWIFTLDSSMTSLLPAIWLPDTMQRRFSRLTFGVRGTNLITVCFPVLRQRTLCYTHERDTHSPFWISDWISDLLSTMNTLTSSTVIVGKVSMSSGLLTGQPIPLNNWWGINLMSIICHLASMPTVKFRGQMNNRHKGVDRTLKNC